jgi:hypothetical protein
MAQRRTYIYPFVAIAVVAGLLGTVAFQAWARTAIANVDASASFAAAAASAFENWHATALLTLPFIVAAFLSAEVAYRGGSAKGIVYFVGLTVVLSCVLACAHFSSERALAQHQWTAASISLAFAPIVSVPIVVVAALFAGGLSWRFGKDET